MYQTLCNVRMNNMHVCVCVCHLHGFNVFTSTETSPEEVTGVLPGADGRGV